MFQIIPSALTKFNFCELNASWGVFNDVVTFLGIFLQKSYCSGYYDNINKHILFVHFLICRYLHKSKMRLKLVF